MNTRKPNQVKAGKRKTPLLIQVSVIAILIAVLLCGCGKKKAEDVQATDTGSTMPPAAETTYTPPQTEYAQAPVDSSFENTPTESAGTGIYLLNSMDVENFRYDYGFSENRAWVRSNTNEKYLIDPNGEIVYAIPSEVTIEGSYDPVLFEEFHPVENGVTYVRGKCNYQYDVSMIIDANGNELASFIGTDDMVCYIAGRTDNRFLLACIDKSGTEGKFYCIPIGTNGKATDAPRLVFEGYVDENTVAVNDLGEGIFLLTSDNDEYIAHYNLNNNTVQKSTRWEGNDPYCRFYHGTTLTNGYLLTVDQLQQDRTNLVLTNRAGYFGTTDSHLSQYGRIWSMYSYYNRDIGLFDQTGREISIPREIGEDAELQTSDDGYVLFKEYASTGKTLLSLMGPDNSFLYVQSAFSEDTYPTIGRGGFVLASGNSLGDYGIIDRAGTLHNLNSDLSAIPGLSDLHFMGFGSGYLLETESHLGIDPYSDSVAIIRSLDGKQEITTAKSTSHTQKMHDTLANNTVIDLSQAKPVGVLGGENAAETTSENDVRNMDEFGIVVVDSLWDERQEYLLFEKDGIRITWCDWILEVENGNPDNKKASVNLAHIYFDGIYIDKNYPGSHGGTGVLKSGENAEIFARVFGSEEMFMTEVSSMATGLAELPLLETTLHFTVQIGSDTEPVDYTRIIRSAYYSEETLSALYGEHIGDFVYEGEPVYTAYRIQDENVNAFAIRNRTDTELDSKHFSLFVAEGQWYVNGEPYGKLALQIPAEGVGIVTFPDVDSVYKELELPNGTPIDLSLSLPVPGTELYGTMVTLDLGQISK